jgi:hypothetical protein
MYWTICVVVQNGVLTAVMVVVVVAVVVVGVGVVPKG